MLKGCEGFLPLDEGIIKLISIITRQLNNDLILYYNLPGDYLLIPKRLHGIGSRCFYRLKTNCQQGYQHSGKSGNYKRYWAEIDLVNKTLQPLSKGL